LLTTINGYGELALMETSAESPSHQKLLKIISASERASNLTRQLVAFSGKQYIPVEPVELNRLVMSMVDEVRGTICYPIDFELQPTDRAVLANTDFLSQVILLLCASARSRMSGGDRLIVRTGQSDLPEPRRMQGGELQPGTYGTLTVSDSGRFLDPESMENIFEPLSLIRDDLGVDLSPIYGIVQSLGGGIAVLAGETCGTTFEILLPCMKAKFASAAAGSSGSHTSSKLTSPLAV
jgi:signal transduction histidine kinase